MAGRFDEYREGISTVKLDKEDIKVYATEDDYADLIRKFQEDKISGKLDFDWYVDFFKKIAYKGDPSLRDESGFGIFVRTKSMELPIKLLVTFRLITEEELGKIEKQVQEKVKNEKSEI